MAKQYVWIGIAVGDVRSEMKELGAEVLAGRAKTVSARHYLLNELDVLAEQYRKAWEEYLSI